MTYWEKVMLYIAFGGVVGVGFMEWLKFLIKEVGRMP